MKLKEKKNHFLLPAILGSIVFGIVVLPFWIWSEEWNPYYTISAIILAGLWIGYAHQSFQRKRKVQE